MLSKERGQYFQEQYDKLEYQFANQELNNKCNQLQSNWNSLREWLEKVVKLTANIDEKMTCKNVLDKMNELEGKDKE